MQFQVEQEFSQDEIYSRFTEGRLCFPREPSPPTGPDRTPATTKRVRSLSDQEKESLQQRWKAIEPLTSISGKPQEADYRRRALQLQQAGIRCSARTLRRHYRVWLTAGKDRLALVPRIAKRGGRGILRRHGLWRRHPQLRRLMEEAINIVYLNKARRPISAVTRRVLEDLERTNSRLPAAQAIPVPREAALARAIARRITQLDPWEVDRERWGWKIANSRHAFKGTCQLARRILDRVEIDHSPLKVVVGTDAGPIGQPWLTILIDYYSRMVVGFCMGFEPPSYAVIMEALRHAILPKTYLAQRYARVQGSWPCCGLPSKLVCDRGSDLTSKDLEEAAFQLGIELDFNPPRTPHLKGTVESFFDGLNDHLASSLPGRTFRNWADRADYKPDDGPLLTYEALMEIIHIHLIDVYAIAKHPTSTKTRLEMWLESASIHPPSLPSSAEELLVLLSKKAERKLTVRGVELSGMFYSSDDLMALRSQLAANNLQVDHLSIRYNPWDLGQIWAVNPIDGSFLLAIAADPVMKEMTEYQWKVLKRAVRDRFDRPEHQLSLAAGRNAIRDVITAALQKPSRRRRSRAMRYLHGSESLSQESMESQTEDRQFDACGSENSFPAVASANRISADEPASEGTFPPSAEIQINPDDIDVSDWEVASPDL